MKNFILIIVVCFFINNLYGQESDSSNFLLKLNEIESEFTSGYYAYGGNFTLISKSYYVRFNVADTSNVVLLILNSDNDTLKLFDNVLNPNCYQINFELRNEKFIEESGIFYGYLIMNNSSNRKRNLFMNNDITFKCKIGFF